MNKDITLYSNIIDTITNTPIVGAKIIASDGSKVISNYNGEYSFGNIFIVNRHLHQKHSRKGSFI